jgi:hypothetical protein
MDWLARFDAELERAQQARARGNEGQARVCARRAAGIAAAEYFERRGQAARSGSAIDILNQLALEPSLPAESASILTHLLQQVDTEFKLPEGVDLISEARLLRRQLLPE